MASNPTAPNPTSRVLIYVLRRDLRLSDNPVFHELAREYHSEASTFTHILPLYVFAAHQIEISGFIPEATDPAATPKSPYPEARSQVAGFWRCGPHRAKFLAESVWDLKQSLENVGNGLIIRTGMVVDIVRDIIEQLERGSQAASESTSTSGKDATGSSSTAGVEVTGVWMTADEGSEEKVEQGDVQRLLEDRGKQFRLFQDEKYYVDEYGPQF
jgi:deoxyribodipyrimidine photo-lyase